MDRRIKSAAACAASVMLVGLISGQRASAAPYASMISESGGDITFTLNEPADDVVIIRDGVPTSLGPLGTGSHTVPRSGAASYSIRATKTAAAGFFNQTGNTSGITGLSDGTPTAPALQISDDNNVRNSFHAVRGVAVNRNPANGASFGWVYVSNANTNTTGGFPTPVRSVSDGIYVNGADGSDPLNQGDTALNPGLNFAASESPYRIALDKDGFLYIADWSDTSGTVYRTNNTVTVGSQLLAGSGGAAPFAPSAAQTHGSVAAVYVEGTSAAGNLTLFTIDEDMTPDPVTPTQRNGLWRYDIGAGTTTNNTTIPTLLNGSYGQIDFVSQTMSMTRGPDGKFYITDFRFDGNESGLFVLSPTGTSLYRSRTDAIQRNFDEDPALTGLQDPFRTMRDVAVSPDGQWIAALRGDGTVFIAPLIDGIPDLPNRTYIPTFDPINFGRDLDFDAAGNLYVVSSGNQALRVFSPGKVSLTTYKSDGSFEVHNEPEWFATTGGNVSSPANWMLGYLPNGVSEIAKFGRMTTSAATITIDSPITLGMLKIDNPNHSYTIAGSSTITLDAFGEPRITAISGSHTITAPVLANKNIQLSAAAGATLTVNNLSLSGGPTGTLSISTGGSGTVIVPNFRAGGGLTVRYGTAQVAAGTTANSAAGASVVGRLAVLGGGRLDLNNNSLIITVGDATISSSIAGLIKTGLENGGNFDWLGPGIGSTQANVQNTTAGSFLFGLGEILNDLGQVGGTGPIYTDFAGVSGLVGNEVLVKFTYFGDADLSGSIDATDYSLIDNGYVNSLSGWLNGDFDYSGSIDATDYALIDNAYVNQAGPLAEALIAEHARMFGGEYLAALRAIQSGVIPEPATIGLIGCAAMSLRRRRVRGRADADRL